MSNSAPKLELKLNLSPPRAESPTASSVFSSDNNNNISADQTAESSWMWSNQASSPEPEVINPMVLVGCPRCLMYVMLSEVEDPKCPKCKSTVLLDFLNDQGNNVTKKTTN